MNDATTTGPAPPAPVAPVADERPGHLDRLEASILELARVLALLTTAADDLAAISHECRWMLRLHRKRTDPGHGRFLDHLAHHPKPAPGGFLKPAGHPPPQEPK